MSNKIGDKLKISGLDFYIADNQQGKAIVVRDFYGSDKVANNVIKSMPQAASRIAQGAKNIRQNAEFINNCKGINDLKSFKNDTVFLIGSGGSLNKIKKYLPRLSEYGTVIATNRAVTAFENIEENLNYAFFCDAQSFIFAQDDSWEKIAFNKIDAILSFDAHPILRWSEFKEYFWFGINTCNHREYIRAEQSSGIDRTKTGVLDGSNCALFSQLNLCAKLKVKRVILLGHDFSIFDCFFHFCEKLNIQKHLIENNVDFSLTDVVDVNCNKAKTLGYLLRASRVIAYACKFLSDNGVEIINGTCEGILTDKWIKNISLDKIII